MSKKILIVEDEEILLNLLHKKLINAGYEVDIAKNGKEGLEKFLAKKPDIVLLDILMPIMGGFEFMKELGKHKEAKGVPIVIISNSGQPVELSEAQKLGATDWLVKAEFDPQEVLDKVMKHIGK